MDILKYARLARCLRLVRLLNYHGKRNMTEAMLNDMEDELFDLLAMLDPDFDSNKFKELSNVRE